MLDDAHSGCEECSASHELTQEVEIGIEVGFQIDKSDEILAHVVGDNGDKTGFQ